VSARQPTRDREGKNGAASAEHRLSSGDASLWERAVALLGALMVGGVFAYLGWQSLTASQSPPAISVQVTAIEAQPAGYLVLFEARNDGASSAAAVEIVGQLTDGAATHEEARTTLDYLPSGSSDRGGLLFTQDPRRLQLVVRASGYAEP
jgi:uncharacterized protein (TIGR02588 family)